MSYRNSLAGMLMLTAFAAIGHATAQETPRFAGPLLTPGPELPKGVFNIEPYLINSQLRGVYDAQGDRHHASAADGWQLALPMMYGVHERLTLGLSLNATYDHAPGYSRAFDVGDSTVSALFGAWRSEGPSRATLTLIARQRIPTGHHDRLQDRRISIATGQGVASTSLGMTGQAYFLGGQLRARASTSWRIPGASTGVRGESAFGTEPDFQGRVRLGSAQTSTLSAEYSLSPRWVVAGELVHERSGHTQVSGRVGNGAGAQRVDRRDPASWRFSVVPVLQYHFSDSVALVSGVQVSLAGRNSAAVVVPQVALNAAF